MNKFWKWFLIVLGVVIVLGVIAVVVIGFTHGFGRMGFDGGRFSGFDGFRHRYGGFAMPGRPGGSGMMPGMGLIGLLLACFGIAVVVGAISLVIMGVMKMTSHGMMHTGGVTSPQPPDENQIGVVPSRSCSHCGKPAQADWVTCPYCGEKL
jgi:hypothetical protein